MCMKRAGAENGSVVSGRKGAQDLACKILLPGSQMSYAVREKIERDLASGILPPIFPELWGRSGSGDVSANRIQATGSGDRHQSLVPVPSDV